MKRFSSLPFVVALPLVLASLDAAAAPPRTAPPGDSPDKVKPADVELERQALETEHAERELAQKRFAETRAEQEKEGEQEARREAQRQLVEAQHAARLKEEREAQEALDRYGAAVVRRRLGIGLTGGAVVFGVAALAFAYKGSSELSQIESGTLGSGAAIDEAAKTAQTDRTLGAGFGIAAGAMALVGLPLLFSSLGSYGAKAGALASVRVATAPLPGGGAFGLTVPLR